MSEVVVVEEEIVKLARLGERCLAAKLLTLMLFLGNLNST